MPIIRCPSCGQEIDSNSRFCVHCTARICPGCHGPVPPRAVYCPHCGFSVGPAMPGAAEQQPAPPPPPRVFPSSQGGIIGPQPRQQPPYPQTPSTPMPGAVPQPHIPPGQYGTGDQTPVAPSPPGTMPYVSAQQPPISTQKTFVDTGPIRARRRFPRALVIILIIAVIILSGFAVFKAGWLEGPLNTIQASVADIQWLNWLPFGPRDTTAPVISGAEVSDITETSAIITWQTDEPATTQAMACEGPECIPTELDENLVTNHSANLSDLKPNTAYHFSVISKDARKNEAIAEGNFTTSAQAAAATLTISGINASSITDVGATIIWVTDKAATSQLEYGTTNTYGSTTALNQDLNTSHSITLTGLKPSTTYHFKVKTKDATGNEATSQDQVFTTRSTVSVATETGPEVGKRAPDFTLQDINGKTVKLSESLGKKVIVNFWQDVQQSRNELSVIQEAYNELPQGEVAIFAISWKQTPAVTQNVVNIRALTLPILIDEKGEVAEKYDVISSPVTLFIDAQGVVRHRKNYPDTLKTVAQIESILNSIQ